MGEAVDSSGTRPEARSRRLLRRASARALGVALVTSTAVAVADVAAGRDTVLIGLLLAGPLLAATGASPSGTVLASAYALALALLLGPANDFFGSGDHLSRLATVAVGGAVAVWMAMLRQRHERDSERLGLQYALARALADADDLESAAPHVLEAVGRPLGWDAGGLWELDSDGAALRWVGGWHQDDRTGGFEGLSGKLALRPGEGLSGRVWEAASPVWIRDVTADPELARTKAAGLHGAAGFPVVARGELLGVVELFRRRPMEADADLLRLMEGLGAQVGDFVAAVRSRQALRESEARKAAILESALDCVVTIDHEGRVLEFNQAAQRTFGYAEDEAVGRELAELVVPPFLRDAHRTALRRYVETEESTILGRRVELIAMRADRNEFPVEVAITRIAGQEPPMFTGYLRDITDRRRADEDRERLLRFEQLARADATQAKEQLEAILRGVADGVTAQDVDGRLVFANDAAVRMLGYPSLEKLLAAPLDEVMSEFELIAEDGSPFPLERLPGRRALAGEDAPEELLRFRVAETGEERWSLVKATPIRDSDGRVVMAINVFEDISEHRRTEREQRFLSETGRLLSASLDPDETLERVATLAVPEIADWCVVDVRDPGGELHRVALVHSDPENLEKARELQRRYPPDPRAPRGVHHVLRTGESELYPEIPDAMLQEGAVDERHLELLRDFGFRSAMLVPMIARGRTLGVLTFVTGRSGRRFDEADLALATAVAERCATAIDNARLFAERTYIAKTLQQSLLPAELPIVPGVETAARFRASGEGTEVGGDFYDLFQTGPRGWTMVIGDVCGKGPDAAAVTALARYTLRAAAMREPAPSRSLRVLNEALLRQRDDRRFCTVAYAYVEPGEGGAQVRISCGGHPLPLLLRPDGGVEPLGRHGTLLGVVPDPDLEDLSVPLEPGDALVFYTDGVTDARGKDGVLGERRLREVLASCRGQDAEAIAGRVEQAAVDVQEGPPRDDIAVVVLRVAP